MTPKTASNARKATFSDQPFEIMKLPKEVLRMILKEYLLMSTPIVKERVLTINRRIRDKIGLINAAFALPAGDSIPLDRTQPTFIEESRIIRQSEFLNIFLVSRTIYNEAMPIYFGQNIFVFHSTDTFATFVTKIGPNCRWQLGRARIFWEGNAPAKAARLLGECFGLRQLTIQLSGSNYTSCNRQAPHEARLSGMKDLLRVRGLTKVEVVIPTILQCHCPRHRNIERSVTNIADSEGIASMISRLELLKQPIDPKKIKRYVKDTERLRANP